MKVLLTGASGIFGTAIHRELLEQGHEVIGFGSHNIDLIDRNGIAQKVAGFRPDVIIHSAAMTAVDRCERERDLAYATNVEGTENMAIAAQKAKSRLVYISSCGVYGNGKDTPYHEMNDTHPVNYHHFTKLEGEKKVQQYLDDYLIIRPGWLFGGTAFHQKNFVEARRKEALQHPVLKSAFDKNGSPTYTKDAARQLLVLLERNLNGIFNVSNEGEASRFNYVSEIIRLLKLPGKVEPVSSQLFPRPAQMPDNEALENRNLNLHKCNQMRDWKTALKDYIRTTYE